MTVIRARRVTFDVVLSRLLAAEPGVRRVPARAVGLIVEDGVPPRVTGVRLAGGAEVRADMVVDAGGRRSPVKSWLAGLALSPSETVDPCHVSYYGRHFRIRGADRPRLNTGFADIHEFPTHSQFMFLGDNDTAMLAMCVEKGHPVMKRLRHPDAYAALLAANDAFGAWAEVLEPLSPVFVLGALDNRMHGLVVDDRPIVLGLHQVGDAAMMTNPTRGRGISMALAAAGVLHDLVTANATDPDTAARSYAAWQCEVLAESYREAVAGDDALGHRLRANLLGDTAPANAPRVELPDGHPVTSAEIEWAAGGDPDLFRMFLRALHVLDDERAIADVTVAERVRRSIAADPVPPRRSPRPNRLDDPSTVDSVLAEFG